MSDSEQRRVDQQPSAELADSSLRADPLLPALHDVPVPSGLERRLLESLALAAPVLDVSDACQQAPPAVSARKPHRFSRRMWLSGTLAAGCGGVLLGNYGWLRRPLLQHEVIHKALRWPQRLADRDHDGWDDVNYVHGLPMPVNGIPIPMDLQAQRSRYLKTEFSSRTVVYDVRFRGEKLYLFVIKTWRDLSALPSAPPVVAPMNQTGPWIVVSWRAAGYLYVVALPKSAKPLYHKLLRVRPSGLV